MTTLGYLLSNYRSHLQKQSRTSKYISKNTQIMVSLNFDDMDNCKISNQNKILKNKSQKLS